MENTATSPTDSGGSDTSLITEQVRQGAQQVAEGTQQAVSQAAEGAKRQARSFVEQQKGQATETLHQVHTALSQTSQNLRNQNQSAAAGLIDTATGKLQDACQYLEAHNTGEIVADLEDMARSNVPVFLGGAFALGILAARFLKSSTPRRTTRSGAYTGRSYPGPYTGQYPTGQYATGQYATGQYTADQLPTRNYPAEQYPQTEDYATSAQQPEGRRSPSTGSI